MPDFIHCNRVTAISFKDYLLLSDEEKYDYFVSNTIVLDGGLASVVFNDLYNTHGKYTFITREIFPAEIPVTIAMGIREQILLSN